MEWPNCKILSSLCSHRQEPLGQQPLLISRTRHSSYLYLSSGFPVPCYPVELVQQRISSSCKNQGSPQLLILQSLPCTTLVINSVTECSSPVTLRGMVCPESLAELTHRHAAPASILFGCCLWGIKLTPSSLTFKHSLDNSLQSHKQM